MGLLRSVFHVITLGIVASNKELERRNTPCIFGYLLSKERFEQLAIDVAKRIKRLTITVNNQFVSGEVRTQSGISTWGFKLDYNDFGNVTGRYWILFAENSDSKIPESYAKQLQEEIKNLLSSFDN